MSSKKCLPADNRSSSRIPLSGIRREGRYCGKKIALLHFAYPPNTGGVETLIKEHAGFLTELNFDVTIFTGSGEEKNPRIKLIVIPELQSVMNFNAPLQDKILKKGTIDDDFYQLAKLIEQKLENVLQPFDVIIVHNMLTIVRNLPFIFAFTEYVKKNPNKKYIAWTHDHSYISEFKIKDLATVVNSELEKRLLITPINGVKYIAISESFKKPLIQLMNLKTEDVEVIPNGINIKRFLEIDDSIWTVAEKYKFTESFPIIVSPVNILGRKKLDYCIDIINCLRAEFPNLLYIITGNPSRHHSTNEYFNQLKKQVSNYHLEKNVLFLTEIFNKALSDSEIHDFYSFSDAIFLFSESENFGLPLLEAFLTRTAIFTSDLSVFHEIAGDFVNYIDYKTIDPKQAAAIILSYIKNNKIILANKLTRTKYNLESIIQKRLIPLLE